MLMMISHSSLSMAARPVLFLGLIATVAWGCSVPVFRYALEHWEADPFRAIVFHSGALSPAQQAQVTPLQPNPDAVSRPNMSVMMVDVNEPMSPEIQELWKQQPTDVILPRLTLRYPRNSRILADVFSGSLAEVMKANLTDSPARREIIRRLADGQSAVWLLLESGDQGQDEAAAKLLQDRLDYLSGVLTLPELDEQDIANGLVSVGQEELRLEFSILRLSRADAQEGVFKSMLLGTEEDLHAVTEPMVFPIFGRGRALYALVGKGIRAETIDDAANFLIGKCSCQVKEQNPGTDLLLTADWKALAKASPLLERDLPDLAHLVAETAPVTVTTEPAGAAVPASLSKPVLLAAALVLGLLAVLFSRRSKT